MMRVPTGRRAVQVFAGLAGAALVLAPTASASAASGHSVHGCPYGWECLYKYDNYRGAHGSNVPDQKFYTYGLHRISGFTGESGSTVDNQSPSKGDTHVAGTCYYRNSAGTNFYSEDRGNPYPDEVPHFDLLPVNSVRLVDFSAGHDDCPYS